VRKRAAVLVLADSVCVSVTQSLSSSRSRERTRKRAAVLVLAHSVSVSVTQSLSSSRSRERTSREKLYVATPPAPTPAVSPNRLLVRAFRRSGAPDAGAVGAPQRNAFQARWKRGSSGRPRGLGQEG